MSQYQQWQVILIVLESWDTEELLQSIAELFKRCSESNSKVNFKRRFRNRPEVNFTSPREAVKLNLGCAPRNPQRAQDPRSKSDDELGY